MSQILRAFKNQNYYTRVIDGPIGYTDFSHTSGLWIPAYNGFMPNNPTMSFNAPKNNLEINIPGPQSAVVQNHQYVLGVRSRFRVWPDSNGALELKVRVEDLIYEAFPANNGNYWGAGMLIDNMDYSGNYGMGLGVVSQSNFPGGLDKTAGGIYYWTTPLGNANFSMGSYNNAGPWYTSPVVKMDLRFYARFYTFFGTDGFGTGAWYSNYNDAGEIAWTTWAGDWYHAGPNIWDGWQIFLGFFSRHEAKLSFKITYLEVTKGKVACGIA